MDKSAPTFSPAFLSTLAPAAAAGLAGRGDSGQAAPVAAASVWCATIALQLFVRSASSVVVAPGGNPA